MSVCVASCMLPVAQPPSAVVLCPSSNVPGHLLLILVIRSTGRTPVLRFSFGFRISDLVRISDSPLCLPPTAYCPPVSDFGFRIWFGFQISDFLAPSPHRFPPKPLPPQTPHRTLIGWA